MSNEVGFLHADKHESLLQIDSPILMGMVKHFQSSQNSKLGLYNMSKKKLKMKLIFVHVDKHESFLKVYSIILGIKVS